VRENARLFATARRVRARRGVRTERARHRGGLDEAFAADAEDSLQNENELHARAWSPVRLHSVRDAQRFVVHVIRQTRNRVRVLANRFSKLLGIDDEDDVFVLFERGASNA